MAKSESMILIAGMPEDKVFCHVCFVANSLSEMLPNFHFKKICKTRGQWELWLEKFCKTHNWSHTKSPLVWRELSMRGGKATYLGDASKFWEFVNDHYGIESRLTEDELKALKLDTMQEYEVEAKIKASKKKKIARCVTVLGAGRSLCPDLVAELITIEKLHLANGVEIRLYDEPGHILKIRECMEDISAIGGGLRAATVVRRIRDGLVNCDLLILLDEIFREDGEEIDAWLKRNQLAMLKLAELIKMFAPDHMRVIFCSMGPTCFCAGVLANAASNLKKSNIAVIAAHYGLEIVYSLVNLVAVPLREVGCPPVWGFLGVNQFIDTCHMVHKHEVYRPNNRALRPHKDSTLPLGIKYTELRWFFYLAHDKNPHSNLLERKAISNYQVGRNEDFQKCRAICDMLRLWYDDESNADGEIISLGIYSDGGNFTDEATRSSVKYGTECVLQAGEIYRDVLLDLTNHFGEIIVWPNLAKFLFYTCLNEVTRMVLYEIAEFICNNYSLF